MKFKGWPPSDNKARSNKGYDSGRVSGGLDPGDKRPGSRDYDRGTPASDSFRFPMTKPRPTKAPECK